MVNLSGSIGIKAKVDTAEAERGFRKLDGLLDSTGRKAKETNVFFERMNGLMKEMSKMGLLFGGALVGALTGVLASSPHFKAFAAKMKGPFMKLSKFMGETFKPVMDKVFEHFKSLVDWVTTDPKARKFFDWLGGFVGKQIDFGVKFLTTGYKLLFGEEGDKEGGIVGKWNSLIDGTTKKLGLGVINPSSKALFLMAAGLVLMGHPIAGGFIAAWGVGQIAQDKLGDPDEWAKNNPIVNEITSGGRSGTIMDMFDGMMVPRATLLGARQIMITLQNKTGIDYSAGIDAVDSTLEVI